MSSGGTIIICGTAGEEQGDVTITMYKGSVFGVALAYDWQQAQTYPGVSEIDALRIKRVIERSYQNILDAFEDVGIPYVKHVPHPQT